MQYTFNTPLSIADGIFLSDLDYAENIELAFYDSAGTLLPTTGWTGGYVQSVAGQAIPVNTGTSIRLADTSNADLASLTLLLIPAPGQQVARMVVTQSNVIDGSYEFSFVHGICDADHGDAPASYGDAAHTQLSAAALYLGTTAPDKEAVALAGNATGDDTTGIDDEGGVTIPPLTVGQSTVININVTGAGYLNAWIDWNGDGDFADAGEQVATGVQDTNADGAIPLTVNVPATATTGQTYARFRWSGNSALGRNGLATGVRSRIMR
ncbi:MAG: CshA/CshB family fibrillar adhesin-related protein [Thiolinea sp.]